MNSHPPFAGWGVWSQHVPAHVLTEDACHCSVADHSILLHFDGTGSSGNCALLMTSRGSKDLVRACMLASSPASCREHVDLNTRKTGNADCGVHVQGLLPGERLDAPPLAHYILEPPVPYMPVRNGAAQLQPGPHAAGSSAGGWSNPAQVRQPQPCLRTGRSEPSCGSFLRLTSASPAG